MSAEERGAPLGRRRLCVLAMAVIMARICAAVLLARFPVFMVVAMVMFVMVMMVRWVLAVCAVLTSVSICVVLVFFRILLLLNVQHILNIAAVLPFSVEIGHERLRLWPEQLLHIHLQASTSVTVQRMGQACH